MLEGVLAFLDEYIIYIMKIFSLPHSISCPLYYFLFHSFEACRLHYRHGSQIGGGSAQWKHHFFFFG